MSPVDYSRYPANWGDMVHAALVTAGHRCQGCGCHHHEDETAGTILTTHHPDRDPENPDARLTVLCARCHLSVESHARRRERINASRVEGETIAGAWRRAQNRTSAEQMEIT